MNITRHILLFLALMVGQSRAAGLMRENFEATRAMGMGNAFVALADDANAIWLNPAGLAYVKGNHFNMLDVTLGVDSLETLIKIKNFVFNGDSTNFLQLDSQWLHLKFKPTFVRKNFGFSLYSNMFGFFDMSSMEVLGISVPNADVYAFNDLVAVAAIGFPITPYFSLGFNARGILRTSIDANVTAFDLLSQLGLLNTAQFETAIYDYLKTLAGTGYGLGLTVSALAKIPLGKKGAPTLSLAGVIEDVGQTTFSPILTGFAPPPIRPNYIAGMAITWPSSKDAKITMSMDVRHIFEPVNFSKIAHFGLEYRHKFFGLRGGFAQGDWTAGVSWELLPHTRVHAATFAKELGDGFRERLQRFYMAQVIIGFAPY